MMDCRLFDLAQAPFHDLINKKGGDYEQLMELWNTLSSNEKDMCSHPVYLMNFLKCAAECRNKNFKLAVIYENDSCVSVLPIEISTLFPNIPGLYFVNVLTVSSGTPVAFRAEYHRNICRALLDCRFQYDAKPLWILFNEVDNTNTFLDVDLPKIVIPDISTKKVYTIPWSSPSDFAFPTRKWGKSLGRKINKLSRMGQPELQIFEDSREMPDAWDEFVELENMGWKGREGSSLCCNDLSRNFYRSVLFDFAETSSASILKLSINGITIAMFAGIFIENRYYGLLITYNEEFGSYSPGHIMIYHILKDYLPARGTAYLDMLFTCNWFSVWKPDELKASKIILFPGNYIRTLFSLMLNARNLSHKILKRGIRPSTVPDAAGTGSRVIGTN